MNNHNSYNDDCQCDKPVRPCWRLNGWNEPLNRIPQAVHLLFKYNEKITNGLAEILVEQLQLETFLTVAGIAKPEYFYKHLKVTENNFLTFPDHHHFSEKDIELILKKSKNNKIVTTEKDFMRLQGKIPQEKLYYLPIETSFLFISSSFDSKILNYVGKSTRNCNVFKK